MRIAICDSNEMHSQKILSMLAELHLKAEVYQSGEALLAKCDLRYDVAFIDIELIGADSLTVARALQECNPEVKIVFVSSKDVMDDQSGNWPFIKFWLMPDDADKMIGRIPELVEKRGESSNMIDIICEGACIFLYWDEIIYCENVNRRLEIHIDGETFITRMTMRELEGRLDKEQFGCPYKGYLVNYQYVYKIENETILLRACKDVLPLSRDRKKGFTEECIKYHEQHTVQ